MEGDAGKKIKKGMAQAKEYEKEHMATTEELVRQDKEFISLSEKLKRIILGKKD